MWREDENHALKRNVRHRYNATIRPNYTHGMIIHTTETDVERKHVEAVLAGVAGATHRVGTGEHSHLEKLDRVDAEYRRWGIEDASSAARCLPSPDRVISAARARELDLAADLAAATRQAREAVISALGGVVRAYPHLSAKEFADVVSGCVDEFRRRGRG